MKVVHHILTLLACLLPAFVPAHAQSGPLTPATSLAGQPAELQALNEAVAASGNQAEPRFRRARLLESLGLVDDAMRDYRWLLDHYPERPEAYNNMARLLAASGDLAQAITVLEQGMATHPVYQQIFANLRELFAAMARRAYQAALHEPESASAMAEADRPITVDLRGVDSLDGAPGHRVHTSDTNGVPARVAARDE